MNHLMKYCCVEFTPGGCIQEFTDREAYITHLVVAHAWSRESAEEDAEEQEIEERSISD